VATVGKGDDWIIIMLQISSAYCVPNIIEIDRRLLKLQKNKKGEHFLDHGVDTILYAWHPEDIFK